MPIPVKDGYAFNGWYSSKADGSGYRIEDLLLLIQHSLIDFLDKLLHQQDQG